MEFHEMPVGEIQRLLKERGLLLTDDELTALSGDPRAGVRKIYQQFCRQRALMDKENLRLEAMDLYEKEARRKGFALIAGIDEVGRGPLAGPVVTAAVILPEKCRISGIDDSKKVPPGRREKLYHEIVGQAVCWAVGMATVEEIDSLNILQATLLAMRRALGGLSPAPEYVLVDAVRIPGIGTPQLPIIKGDGKSVTIAAASIVAKVTRDRMMEDFDGQFPGYGFAQNKGYGTSDHIEALKKNGCCKLHRKTFIKNFLVSEAYGSLW